MNNPKPKLLAWLHLFRNMKTGKHFITNLFSGKGWREVGDLVEVAPESFRIHGPDIVLSYLLNPPQPILPDDRISHKDIRRRTQGMKEVGIMLWENDEIHLYPIQGNKSPRELSRTIPADTEPQIFHRVLDELYERARRSL